MADAQKAVELDMLEPVEPQLKDAPRDAERLSLEKEIPSDAHWDLLSNHFTSIKHLSMDSGWNEELNDEKIPLHWPLEKLTVSSSCGEVCKSPWILDGRVPHLVLNYTAGLRFEGPTTTELIRANADARAAAEPPAPAPSGGVTLTWVPDLVNDWMAEKYASNDNPPLDDAAAPQPRLQTLEIVHNDARDTLFRYALARPRALAALTTLSLVARSQHDLHHAPPHVLEDLLPQLAALRTLVLVLGDHYRDRGQLPAFFRCFPPGLRVLRFRGSVSLARSGEVVGRWAGAFGDGAFLPGLERLSFVLDLEDGEGERRAVEEWEEAHPEGYQSAEKKGGAGEDESSSEEEEDDDEGSKEAAGEEKPTRKSGDEAEGTPEVAEIEAAPAEPATCAAPPKVSDEDLARAKRACERVCRAAESRGVRVEPFMGEWNEEFTNLKRGPVDERWEKL
ncbi:hypothetical protein GTA08_BOTSDO13737 [Botryosphaeria dothidea]|uniref:Uncharacterized protein n=1 Tax=Botryosphaeria dothidea TaxID=55169 RepID=A0A8H4J2G3_9PEZI|nr:hypothetical protein GTA08_BOTSDO13737 [Botryosphaeria dothidea]